MALPRFSVCAAGVVPLALLLLLLGLLGSGPSAAFADYDSYLMISPQSPVLEIGTNFTATCVITNTNEATADDLYWTLGGTLIPLEHYTRVNNSALSVTVQVTGEDPTWMLCHCREKSHYISLHKAKFMHGINLLKGYRPEKPENVSCEAFQEDTFISSVIRCEWEPVARQTKNVPTTYTLFVKVVFGQTYNTTTTENHGQVTMRIFPNHMNLQIWVEASNLLGTLVSEPLKEDAGWFVKTNPPSNVKLIPERSFPTSLLMNWTRPLAKEYLKLTHQIRYCPRGSHNWTYVPQADTSKDIQTFRLQYLRPDTLYDIQVRCKNAQKDHGYWSEWSRNATKRTPEDRPRSKTDVWAVFSDGSTSNRRSVQIVCKDPVLSNGKITRFDVTLETQKDKAGNGSAEVWEIPVNLSDTESISNQRNITVLRNITLPEQRRARVRVTAINSVGKSPEAQLGIREKGHEQGSMLQLKVWPEDGQLWLQWNPPNSTAASASEYVLQWEGAGQLDWQRENKSTRRTAIRGNLEKFVCYNVSVYPLYSGWIGKPTRVEAYLEQGAPLEGPSIRLNGPPGRNEAELVWNHIPLQSRRGFITNYTIFYSSRTHNHKVTVPADVTSYTLTSLSSNTKYDTWIQVSTARGSAVGFRHSFTTLKYAPGEIELIVVGVSLSFLFVVLMTMFLCIYKRDVIKRNFWPWIPNPGESTIRDWSPDHVLKAEGPTESCLSGISVLNVDMCDGKSVFEEDKTSLPLKKDKYLSEEHSSGIGGSSCMSSPRQSVSDSDEGGDLADTTASTVQYSSVVASSGYKGQTPGSQAQQAVFSRSESTQPLLESEDHADLSGHEGSRQSQRFMARTSADPAADRFTQLEMEPQGLLEPLDFCSLDDDGEPPVAAAAATAAVSSYMPQLAGYRPQ